MSAFLTWQEFFEGLGISRPTYYKYRRDAKLPPPERIGRHIVFTREYLHMCRKILAAQGLPRRFLAKAAAE